LGFAADSQAKAEFAYGQAMKGLESMRRAGVKLGFGMDLLGETYVQRCREFTILSDVFSPIEILRQVTSIGAEILMQQGALGCIAPNAYADLIVVDGDPLKDIGLLAQDGKRLSLIMKDGEMMKNGLH
jgi:imidazolonepropionase-like amidohydrolase